MVMSKGTSKFGVHRSLMVECAAYPPLPCRASPPQVGRSTCVDRSAISDVEIEVGVRPQPISPLEGEMSGRTERLSWQSSVLPWFIIPDDGVEDGQQLAHGGNDGNDLGLAGSHETISEGFEEWVVTRRDQCCHVQPGPHFRASTTYETLAFPFA